MLHHPFCRALWWVFIYTCRVENAHAKLKRQRAGNKPRKLGPMERCWTKLNFLIGLQYIEIQASFRKMEHVDHAEKLYVRSLNSESSGGRDNLPLCTEYDSKREYKQSNSAGIINPVVCSVFFDALTIYLVLMSYLAMYQRPILLESIDSRHWSKLDRLPYPTLVLNCWRQV